MRKQTWKPSRDILLSGDCSRERNDPGKAEKWLAVKDWKWDSSLLFLIMAPWYFRQKRWWPFPASCPLKHGTQTWPEARDIDTTHTIWCNQMLQTHALHSALHLVDTQNIFISTLWIISWNSLSLASSPHCWLTSWSFHTTSAKVLN